MHIIWGKAHEGKKVKFISTSTPPMLGTITSYMDDYMAHKGKCVLGVI